MAQPRTGNVYYLKFQSLNRAVLPLSSLETVGQALHGKQDKA